MLLLSFCVSDFFLSFASPVAAIGSDGMDIGGDWEADG